MKLTVKSPIIFGFRTIKPSEYRTIGPSVYRTFGQSGLRTIGYSDRHRYHVDTYGFSGE
jgi:hypothetical protein